MSLPDGSISFSSLGILLVFLKDFLFEEVFEKSTGGKICKTQYAKSYYSNRIQRSGAPNSKQRRIPSMYFFFMKLIALLPNNALTL